MSFRKFFIGVLMSLMVGGLFFSTASAQSPTIKAARQNVEKANTKVATMDSALPDTPVARQKALLSILDLTSAELVDVRGPSKLGGVMDQADAILAAEARAIDQRLAMFGPYVELLRSRVARDGQTIEDIKNLAGSFKEWREAAYDVALRHAFDVILVSQSNGIVVTAQRRLEKVGQDVARFQTMKAALVSPLLSLFDDAKTHILAAAEHQAEAQEQLVANAKSLFSTVGKKGPGVPASIELRRGTQGDFGCLPSSISAKNGCLTAFRLASGGYYQLLSGDGSPLRYAPSEVSAAGGVLLALDPLFKDDGVIGIIFIDAMNMATLDPAPIMKGEASAAETILPSPTVQALVKKILAEVNAAYKDFFSMNALVKKLQSAK